MRILAWALWLVLFVVLFAFAVNNTATVDLHFLSSMSWQAPLIAVLLLFFLGGVVFGFLAILPTWFRLRMEIRRLKRRIRDETPVPERPRAPAAAPESIQSVAQGARTTT